jgi:hypothetical protein
MEVSSQMGPFSIVPEWVLDRGLSPTALKLYIVMARFADWQTGMAFPSRETLADRMGCSLKTVDRAVQELVALECVKKIPRGRYASALYKVYQVDPRWTDMSSEQTDLSSEGTDLSKREDKNDHLTITTERKPKNDISKKARQVPSDWKPDEAFMTELAEKFPTLSLDDEVSAFIDYGQAKGAVYKDFKAAFRNWCRNAVKFHGPKTVIHQQPASKSPYVGGPREWVKDMHDMGEHFECKEGEFGCK